MADQNKPMLIYCATSNPGKLREFQLAAEEHDLPVRVQITPLPTLGRIPPPEETGKTIEENAILKGEYYSAKAPGLLIAEDSGLEVLALGGAPGVYSARFGGPGANDDLNNKLLLERLSGIDNRSARFVCVVVLAKNGKILYTARGSVEGSVLNQPRGTNGFGYDPIFFYPPLDCSFGELSTARKFQVSHRGQAVNALMRLLKDNYHKISSSPGR